MLGSPPGSSPQLPQAGAGDPAACRCRFHEWKGQEGLGHSPSRGTRVLRAAAGLASCSGRRAVARSCPRALPGLLQLLAQPGRQGLPEPVQQPGQLHVVVPVVAGQEGSGLRGRGREEAERVPCHEKRPHACSSRGL